MTTAQTTTQTSAPADPEVPTGLRTPPRAAPGATWTGALVALLLVALGAVGVQHLAVQQGWTTGSSWLLETVSFLDGTTASTWVVVVAVVVAVLGLLLVVVGLKPARRTHRPTAVDADLWLSSDALRALVRHRADRVPGVAGVREVKVGRRRVRVDVAAQRDAADVQQRVSGELEPVLGRLVPHRLVVRATTSEEDA